MSDIPVGFAGMQALKRNKMTLAETIRKAIGGYEQLFGNEAKICYVLQSEFDAALDDPDENGELAEVCELVQVMPISKGLPGGHVMAGREEVDAK